jgi:hypothetical protein
MGYSRFEGCNKAGVSKYIIVISRNLLKDPPRVSRISFLAPGGIWHPSHGTHAAAVDRKCDRLSIDFCPVRASNSRFLYQSLILSLQDPADPLEAS